MSNIAIIPARGGSKRIPRKNIKDFLGKPIIAYSIQAALESRLFDEVMVSTDDEEIAKIAKSYGASVPFLRNTETSDDFVPLSQVFVEVLNRYRDLGYSFNYFCSILPTAPLIQISDLIEAYRCLNKENKSVMSIVEYDFPIQRYLKKGKLGLEIGDKEFYYKRSQDLEPMFHDAGQFYWADVEEYLKEKSFYSLHVAGYELNRKYVFDIDTEEDWTKVEFIYSFLHDNKI